MSGTEVESIFTCREGVCVANLSSDVCIHTISVEMDALNEKKTDLDWLSVTEFSKLPNQMGMTLVDE